MNLSTILQTLWPVVLVLFLGVSAGQLSERLKNKNSAVYSNHSNQVVDAKSSQSVARVNALLGAACIVLAAFWGFDVVLSWWLFGTAW